MMLNFNPQIVVFSSQPFWLSRRDEGHHRPLATAYPAKHLAASTYAGGPLNRGRAACYVVS